MPRGVRRKIRKPPEGSDDCLFCNVGDDDELHLGKLYKLGNISAHYYCLLFSSGLLQSGKTDDKGILGFMPADIRKELKRGQRLKCSSCKKAGATIGCICKRCHRTFHLPCGIKKHLLLQFYDEFPAYCSDHRLNQPPLKGNWEGLPTCAICMDDVVTKVTPDTLYPPCCSNGWFHRDCLQNLALTTGYFFRCPLCNNKEDFQSEMRHFGIYIPEQDAAWEREQGAFSELYERHGQCDAITCVCPGGRKQDDDCNQNEPRSNWDLILCTLCGSQGIHIGCGNLILNNPVWECPGCQSIVRKKAPVKMKLRRKVHSPRYRSLRHNSPRINREDGETQDNNTSENRRNRMQRRKLVLPPSTSSDSSCSTQTTHFTPKDNEISKTPSSEQGLHFRMRALSNSDSDGFKRNSMLEYRQKPLSSESEQSDLPQEVVPNLNTTTQVRMREPAAFTSNSSTSKVPGGLQVTYSNSKFLKNTYFLTTNPGLNSNQIRTLIAVDSTDEDEYCKPGPELSLPQKTFPDVVDLSSSDSDSSKKMEVATSSTRSLPSSSKVILSVNEISNHGPQKRHTKYNTISDSSSNEELIVPDVVKKARISPRDEPTPEEHAHSRQFSIVNYMPNNSQSGKDIFVPTAKMPRKRDHQKTMCSNEKSQKITSFFQVVNISDEDEKT